MMWEADLPVEGLLGKTAQLIGDFNRIGVVRMRINRGKWSCSDG